MAYTSSSMEGEVLLLEKKKKGIHPDVGEIGSE